MLYKKLQDASINAQHTIYKIKITSTSFQPFKIIVNKRKGFTLSFVIMAQMHFQHCLMAIIVSARGKDGHKSRINIKKSEHYIVL